MNFIGVDLGWYGKPTGLALLELDADRVRLTAFDRLAPEAAILAWIDGHTGGAGSLIAVDAPLVISNATGSRAVDRAMTSRFGRYHAGCHAANLSRPFAALTTGFSRRLEQRGFMHAASMPLRRPGRYQIEVHPHAASVQLFGLDRIVKYKKGAVVTRIQELKRYRSLIRRKLHGLTPAFRASSLPLVPNRGGDPLKDVEDKLDAIVAAYVGAHWWHWGLERNTVFGDGQCGYIVVPDRSPYVA